MRAIQRVGSYVDIIEGRSPSNSVLFVKLGLRQESFQQIVRYQLATTIAQYYGIVQDGLPQAVHAFKGLNRPLMHGNDMNADRGVMVYSWRPEHDYVWTGSPERGKPIPKVPPLNRVFVVLVREEQQPNDYPGMGSIFGSIEKWNWVKEDPVLPHAPIDWAERYNAKLWSR